MASALLRSKAGDWYEAKAVICTTCAAGRLPAHLSRELRDAVYAWSDWHLAAADAAAHPVKGESRRCYVIRLHDPTGTTLSADRDWVYVGETGKDVESRFLEHLEAYKSGSSARRFGVDLRLDLMVDLPDHGTEVESKAYEAYLALKLELEGYGVKGGH